MSSVSRAMPPGADSLAMRDITFISIGPMRVSAGRDAIATAASGATVAKAAAPAAAIAAGMVAGPEEVFLPLFVVGFRVGTVIAYYGLINSDRDPVPQKRRCHPLSWGL
jgi:hypothetical protein